jgi:hypothetical protein
MRNLKEGLAGSGICGALNKVSTFQHAISPSWEDTVIILGI